MPPDENYKRKLLRLYLDNRCSPQEFEEVMSLLQGSTFHRELLAQMRDDFFSQPDSSAITESQSSRVRKKLMLQVRPETPVVSVRRNKWWYYVAAASAILVVLSIYFVAVKPLHDTDMATTGKDSQPATDIGPGGNKATLTLANGSTIVLDDAGNGNLAQQGNTKVIKLDGKLNYNAAGAPAGEIMYNTISTPRGGQYQVILPDGSQVWLNAASSLRFPTAFTGSERRVEISGEAYFEIAKNKSVAFVVKVGEAEVQVLGTHFNVMAYEDESAVKTTLLEGAVKFVNKTSVSTLVPGQQALMAKNGNVTVAKDVDINKAMAWKNGTFNFRGEDITAISRQLARWYDIDIVNNSGVNELFYAEDIPKNTKLSEVLKVLQLTGEVSFKVEGRKVTVMP